MTISRVSIRQYKESRWQRLAINIGLFVASGAMLIFAVIGIYHTIDVLRRLAA
jgi:hypothetical protein